MKGRGERKKRGGKYLKNNKEKQKQKTKTTKYGHMSLYMK